MRARDLTGQRFGKLVAIKPATNKGKRRCWKMRCDCGNTVVLIQQRFTCGKYRLSCGCSGRQTVQHGLSQTPEYRAWIAMRRRCEDPREPAFKHYGARGISVCPEWRDSFQAFVADVGPRPSASYSLDRYPNNDGNYEPGNVRWATQSQQMRNFRDNKIVNIDGDRMSLAEACERRGAQYRVVYDRLRHGWPLDEAMTTPVATIRQRDQQTGRWL